MIHHALYVLKELWLLLIVLEINPNYHVYISDSLIEIVKNACNLEITVQNDLKVCVRRIDSFASRVICILLVILSNFFKLCKMSHLLHKKAKTFVYVKDPNFLLENVKFHFLPLCKFDIFLIF